MVDEFILSIIRNIPLMFEYCIPGFCTICLKNVLSGKPVKFEGDNTFHIGIYVFVSYLLLLPIRFFCELFDLTLPGSALRCFIAIVNGLIAVWVWLKAKRWKWFRTQYSRINNTPISESVFECCRIDENPTVTVFCKEYFVRGRAVVYDTTGEYQWIALELQEVYDYTKGLIDHWTHHKEYTRYIIPFSEILSIVPEYDENDKKMYPSWYEGSRKEHQEYHNRQF